MMSGNSCAHPGLAVCERCRLGVTAEEFPFHGLSGQATSIDADTCRSSWLEYAEHLMHAGLCLGRRHVDRKGSPECFPRHRSPQAAAGMVRGFGMRLVGPHLASEVSTADHLEAIDQRRARPEQGELLHEELQQVAG